MGSIRHNLAEAEGAGLLFAAGRLTVDGTTLTLTRISPPLAFTGDITAYRLGAGRYQINIANFRGQQSFVIPVVSAGSSSVAGGGAGGGILNVPLATAVTAGSYITGTDTYGFVVGVASAGTFTDADVYFQAFAF